ncbi:MAG: UDP-N-acetylmuramoyl-tripeptide--D-alanyl-D-alanine ligase, partial [Bifidobacteriaceae bacterium]|nr:UDP-N-acetylmuramoyl-tripeptide--D-alanyl-D-alanine ligase [Bifidobacteriaceae bacterium]
MAEIMNFKIVTNSKLVEKGDTFVALGKGFDFIDEAKNRGAKKIIKGEKAFGQAAKKHLENLREKNRDLKVIGITGSYGKTTTKDLLGFVLSKFGNTISAKGSFNNEIGVPITIFEADGETQYLVLEMGANAIGDLVYLTNIAPLDIACILSIGSAHLGKFGSLENVKKAKSEIFEGLAQNGIGLIPENDENCKEIFDKFPTKKITTFSEVPREKTETKLLGEHNLSNISAVEKICSLLDLDMEKVKSAISKFLPISDHRLQLIEKAGLLFLDDSYNANPASMKAALETFEKLNVDKKYAGKKYAVLGKMEELGDAEEKEHKKIGELFANSFIEKVLIYSSDDRHYFGENEKFIYFDNKDSIKDYISKTAQNGDSILVKASNSSKLWEII